MHVFSSNMSSQSVPLMYEIHWTKNNIRKYISTFLCMIGPYVWLLVRSSVDFVQRCVISCGNVKLANTKITTNRVWWKFHNNSCWTTQKYSVTSITHTSDPLATGGHKSRNKWSFSSKSGATWSRFMALTHCSVVIIAGVWCNCRCVIVIRTSVS